MYTRMLFFEEKDLLKYEKGDRVILPETNAFCSVRQSS